MKSTTGTTVTLLKKITSIILKKHVTEVCNTDVKTGPQRVPVIHVH